MNHLYPLEIPEKVDESVKGVDETDIPLNDSSTSKQNIIEPKKNRTQRQASICACEAIRHCLSDNYITNLFCLLGSVKKNERTFIFIELDLIYIIIL